MPVAKLYICRFCSKQFTKQGALNNHIRDSKNHSLTPMRTCVQCSRSFPSDRALQDHLGTKSHTRALAKKAVVVHTQSHSQSQVAHTRCAVCSRKFSTVQALSQHLKSLAHQPRKFKCPFCKRGFKAPSSVALHIESGCHQFTRHHVTAAVKAMDIVPKITIKTIERPPAEATSEVKSAAPVPLPTIITYTATIDAFNGNSYSCFLCTKTFRTLLSLNRHLNSAAHDDNEFKCPKCESEFTLISGFVQHLESRACGLAKNNQVEDYFNGLVEQFSGLLKMGRVLLITDSESLGGLEHRWTSSLTA